MALAASIDTREPSIRIAPSRAGSATALSDLGLSRRSDSLCPWHNLPCHLDALEVPPRVVHGTRIGRARLTILFLLEAAPLNSPFELLPRG